MIDASWVVIERSTGAAVLETFNFELVQFVNLKRYRVATILEHLQSLNAQRVMVCDPQGNAQVTFRVV